MINNANPSIVAERVQSSKRTLADMKEKFGFPFYKRNRPPTFFSNGGAEALPDDLQGQLTAMGFRCMGTLSWGGIHIIQFLDPTGLLKFEYYPGSGGWSLNSYTSDGRSITSGPRRSGNSKTKHIKVTSVFDAPEKHIAAIEEHCRKKNVVPLYRNDQESIVRTWWIYDRFGAAQLEMTVAFMVLMFLWVTFPEFPGMIREMLPF